MPSVVVQDHDGTQPKIVLVEDDDGDAKAVERAFKKSHILNPITRMIDGRDALDTLRGTGSVPAPEKPYLLLVDLNMPRMDGIKFIKALREDPHLRQAVVFVLTTSNRDEDKAKAYDLNVAGYIVKETAGRDFLKLVELMDNFWRIVELPE